MADVVLAVVGVGAVAAAAIYGIRGLQEHAQGRNRPATAATGEPKRALRIGYPSEAGLFFAADGGSINSHPYSWTGRSPDTCAFHEGSHWCGASESSPIHTTYVNPESLGPPDTPLHRVEAVLATWETLRPGRIDVARAIHDIRHAIDGEPYDAGADA